MSYCCRQNTYSFYFDSLRQYGIVYLIFVRVRVGMKLLKELVAQPHCQRQKNIFKLNITEDRDSGRVKPIPPA